MSQIPPFDQDEPPRRRPRSAAGEGRRRGSTGGRAGSTGSSGRVPRGEHGPAERSRRGAGAGEGRRKGGDGGSGDTGGAAGVLAGLPRWVLPAGAGVVVLLVLLLVLRSCGGGSSSSDAGACLTDLAEHLPADSDLAYGTDFVQAAGAGWTLDGSLEEIGAAMADTGTIPDPVTAEYRMKPLATPDQFAARTGVDPGEVVCSLGTGTRFVLAGSFDPPAVNGSQAGSDGSLTANEDLLGMDVGRGDPKVLLEPADEPLADDEAMMAAVELLRDNGAYSVIVQRGDGENGRALAAGVGAGGDSDDRSVVLAWVYGSDDDAKGGRPEIVSRVNSVLKGTVSITAADLELDGSAVTAVVPSRSAPALQELLRQAIPLVDADE